MPQTLPNVTALHQRFLLFQFIFNYNLYINYYTNTSTMNTTVTVQPQLVELERLTGKKTSEVSIFLECGSL
jgi:hypothetical protein